jgi:isoleucyl-tRNA synthetase
VVERLEDYDTTSAGRAVAAHVEELSNWYVRRSRRRFWDGDPAAFATLRHCLVAVAKLLAPLTPFVADEIYEHLDGSEPSVHLCDFPLPDPELRDEELERDMAVAREAVELGRAARAQARVKVRQPLREAVVVAGDRERRALERLADVVLEELNVKGLRFVSDAEELGRWELKPNYRALGPRFGRAMPQVAAAVSSMDAARVAEVLRAGGHVGLNLDGDEHPLSADDLLLALQPLDGYQLEGSGAHAVALELNPDAELRREGLAREVVHAVQNARKQAGLEVSDRITLVVGGDEELVGAVRAHERYVSSETLAVELAYDGNGGDGQDAEIEGRPLTLTLARAAAAGPA